MKNDKILIKSYLAFLEDTEGLSDEDLIGELHEQGIDVAKLQEKVVETVKKGSEKRRLIWRESVQLRRSQLEKLLDQRKIKGVVSDVKNRVSEILAGNYGKGAVSYAEAFFRKKGELTEKDLESLIEDLEDLKILDKSDKKDQ